MTAKTLTLFLAVCAVCAVLGYHEGKAVASLDADARIAQLKQDQAYAEVGRAASVITALQEAAGETAAKAARARALEADLLDARAAIEADRKTLSARIDHAATAAARTCTGLPVDWVREYNAAIGAGTDCPEGGNAFSGCALPPAGASWSALPGLPQGQPLTGPDDVLAHIRDYGAYCRALEQHAVTWGRFDAVRQGGR